MAFLKILGILVLIIICFSVIVNTLTDIQYAINKIPVWLQWIIWIIILIIIAENSYKKNNKEKE